MTTEFDVTVYWVNDKRKVEYRMLKDYSFNVDGMLVTIPKGYATDFATVPRILWPILPPLGRHNPAALVHDFLYDNRIGSRKQADDIFLQLMLQYQVNRIAAYVMYLGVRLGGRKWWKRSE